MPAEPPEANAPPEVSATVEAAAPSPWSLRDLGFFLAFGTLALLLSNFLALAGYVALQPLVGWRTRPEALRDNPFFVLTFQSIFHGLVLGYVYFLVVVGYRRPFWTTLNWRMLTLRQILRFSLGGILLGFAIRFAPTLLPDREGFPLERLFSSPGAAYAVAAFAVLIAPFMEELIFRGVLFSFFERQVGIRFAIVTTAVLFAGLHIPEYWGAWNHVFLIFVVGVVFSLARGLTGSLVASFVLHLAYNATLMAGLYVETQRFRVLEGLILR